MDMLEFELRFLFFVFLLSLLDKNFHFILTTRFKAAL